MIIYFMFILCVYILSLLSTFGCFGSSVMKIISTHMKNVTSDGTIAPPIAKIHIHQGISYSHMFLNVVK